ncbi:cold shock domain-containing protein [Nakamurella sp.]|uniref:cold shock domain-containing protein n=1 Tax=Nakamurella sp. TaxID=1869182 RepID=UPI003B3B0AD9
MTTRGIVRVWHDEQGWGVIDSPATPGGCWAHFSAVAVAGDRSLAPGRAVMLEWDTTPDQDGYRFVATRTWPVGADPIDVTPGTPGDAYRSTLTITVDRDPADPGPAV